MESKARQLNIRNTSLEGVTCGTQKKQPRAQPETNSYAPKYIINMSNIKLAIIIILMAPGMLISQTTQPDAHLIRAHSISLKIMGAPTWPIGISYGQMLTDRISMEMGIGVLSVGAGIEYYLSNPRKNKFNISTGLFGSINFDGYPMVYLPISASYWGRNNFQYSINAGPLYAENVSISEHAGNFSPWFGIGISKRFGEDVDMIRNTQETDLRNIVSIRFGLIYPFAGISYERLLTPHIGLDASIGFLGLSIGSNVYFPSIKPGKIGFKTGITQGVNHNLLAGIGMSTYVPFGIHYLSESSFVFSIDGGPQYWYQDEEFLPGFSIRLGKAF